MMTKEELRKEAEEYATENYEQCIYDDVIGWKTDYEARKQAYLAGAEPREKQIQILGERCLQLQKDKGSLTDRVRELEQKLKTQQLTKAKELLKDFLLMAKVERLKDRYETVGEAEQFLKE